MNIAPVSYPRSVRNPVDRVMTSAKAGVYVPIHMQVVHREDYVAGKASFVVDMEETYKPLQNGVMVNIDVMFVPYPASERFDGMDDFNRSWAGQPNPTTNVVKSVFNTEVWDATVPMYTKLGWYAPAGSLVNDFGKRAYNLAVAALYRESSIKLNQPLETWAGNLHRALWADAAQKQMVPDFDVSMMAGLMAVKLGGTAPVLGIGFESGVTYTTAATVAAQTGGIPMNPAIGANAGTANNVAGQRVLIERVAATAFPNIRADLANGSNMTFNLAQMERAKKTTAFARMREQMEQVLGGAVDDDTALDLMMSGIRVPPIMDRQAYRVGGGAGVVGYSVQKSTDAASLDVSRTTGRAVVECRVRLPQTATGGYLVYLANIQPERVWEKTTPLALSVLSTAGLPDALRDTLSDQPVRRVLNKMMDAGHASPGGLFGYEGLNRQWERGDLRIGGRYYNASNALEDGQNLWQVPIVNPQLNELFFLCPHPFPHAVFADTTVDPFRIFMRAEHSIDGLTQMGPLLQEDRGALAAVNLVAAENPPLIS